MVLTCCRGSFRWRHGAQAAKGRAVCTDFRMIGQCLQPVNGFAVITAQYVAKYGVPPSARKSSCASAR
jgi:hypothetical protein